ncbi:hypothetical protein I0C86_29685 [Plantactinospora sp. S1510]|uniref:Uncharacterized protein n=1 Tax=Plantactinospora alkalitolerans TaxID=2789879 RepID=A0ABS0H4G0_9ACTN|nr:hypothetical protein [Plantactinospora alkalitolerans]MBF9133103.1 hypothetical protein [Plantactinospora alkalitolerans]
MSTESFPGSTTLSHQQLSYRHPKAALYLEVYTPLVEAWFEALRASTALTELRGAAPDRDLVDNLQRLDLLFRDLVDGLFDRPGAVLDHSMAVVAEHRDAVVWEDQMVPSTGAGAAELAASLRHKFKRNISLAMLEALICLESALAYGRDAVGLSGQALETTLRASTPLLASLSVLHDEQEMVRMRHLTGDPREIQHPRFTVADIAGGAFRIAPDKFRIVGPEDQRKIRFASVPPSRLVPSTPTMKCPAHQLTNENGQRLNDELWDLLVDIYRLSGRLT